MEDELKRLTQGAAPVKVKGILLVDAPWYVSFVVRVLGLFVSKKIASRVAIVSEEGVHTRIGGRDRLPAGLLGGCGTYTPRYDHLPMPCGGEFEEEVVL